MLNILLIILIALVILSNIRLFATVALVLLGISAVLILGFIIISAAGLSGDELLTDLLFIGGFIVFVIFYIAFAEVVVSGEAESED